MLIKCFNVTLLINVLVTTSGWTQNVKKQDNGIFCQCYMLGTVETKWGRSKCDQEGVCHCLPNVIGKNCEKCRDGYYGILNGKGCKACKCDQNGSESKRCHKTTGECLCKSGYTGSQCNMCDLPFDTHLNINTCKTPCDKSRLANSILLFENGTCNYCKSNFYLNYTTSQCTPCPACYRVLSEKINGLQENLNELSRIINKTESKDSDTNGFLIELKSLHLNISSLYKTLLKKPHMKEIAKLNHIETILDLTKKGIEDINFYLNGHINYNHLENKLKQLYRILLQDEKNLDSLMLSTENDVEKIKNVAENAEKEADDIVVFVDKMNDDNVKLHDETKKNISAAKVMINEFRAEEYEEFMIFKQTEFPNFGNIIKLISNARKQHNLAKENKISAIIILDEVKHLKLPKWVEHDIKPMLNGTFVDLSEEIQKAKYKYDAIQDILQYISTLRSTPLINSATDFKLEDTKKDLLKRSEETLKNLTKQYQKLQEYKQDLTEKMTNIQSEIIQLNSEIDKKYKYLEELMKLIEDFLLDIKTKDEELIAILEDLYERLKEAKLKRKQIRKDMRDLRELLNKWKHILKLIDYTDKIQIEIKVYFENYEEIIAFFKEIIQYFELIAMNDIDKIEKLFNSYEEYFKFVTQLRKLKNDLKKEVDMLGMIVKSLPKQNPIECVTSLT